MKAEEVFIDGKSYKLGKRIGKGGEGEIFLLDGTPSIALKRYTGKDPKEAKISAMVEMALAQKSPNVAFPVSIARSKAGAFIGFVMKLVSDHMPLHDLYSPGSRKIHFPQADFRFLVRSAANIARAVASVHQSGCVIGDINHSSMLVSSKGTVALIDADSFQIATKTNQFLCKVGVPEYTPPELQGQNFSSILRTSNHDSFGLAIVIFQILFMGRHPFVGTVRTGDIPPLHENIKGFRYVYSDRRNVGMDQPPGTPSIKDFSNNLSELFETAFSKIGVVKRPDALEWVRALEDLEKTLVKCDVNPLHFLPGDTSECPWCEMENQLFTILFLPYFPSGPIVEGRDPGALNFNLDQLWQRIESIAIPANSIPKFSSPKPNPSASAIAAKPQQSESSNSLIVAIGSMVALIGLPQLFFIWLPLIYWGFSKEKTTTTPDQTPLINVYKAAERRWADDLSNWQRRTGILDLLALKEELIQAKTSYRLVLSSEQTEIQNYKVDRRNKQLISFLDGFNIANADIKGIGPSKLAVLASYGVDTAADISLKKLLTIPGFGQETSKPLVNWRASIEQRFVFQQNETESERQEIARIKATIHLKLANLRGRLTGGSANLLNLSQRVKTALSQTDTALKMANDNLQQAKVDLEFLNIAIPTTSQTTSIQTQSPASNRSTSTIPTASSSSTKVSCPRCGTNMVKRLAKKGRNSGSYFWGCGRFPVCKGTRPL